MYLDDLVVCSDSWAEHLGHLRTVFGRLCEFGQGTVTYLGKVVGGGQIHPVQAKVECIVAFPVLTTQTLIFRGSWIATRSGIRPSKRKRSHWSWDWSISKCMSVPLASHWSFILIITPHFLAEDAE